MTHMQIVTMICAALLIYSDVIDLVRGNGSNILISLTLFSLMMWDLDSRAGFVTAISSLILLLTIIVYKNERTTDQLSNEVKSKVEVIHQYLKHIEQLEAEKAELVSEKAELLMALILSNEEIDDIDMHSKNFDLIQKHAKK